MKSPRKVSGKSPRKLGKSPSKSPRESRISPRDSRSPKKSLLHSNRLASRKQFGLPLQGVDEWQTLETTLMENPLIQKKFVRRYILYLLTTRVAFFFFFGP